MEKVHPDEDISHHSMDIIPKVTHAEAEVPKEVPKDEVPKEGGQDPNMSKDQETAEIAKSHIRFPSCRLIFVIMGFFGFIMVYSLRVNISVAIVAMVNATYVKDVSQAKVRPEDACRSNATSEKKDPKFPGTFKFDPQEQTYVSGAFYWGYVILQVPGGTLAQKVGGKIVLVSSMVFTSIFTLLTPVCAEQGGLGGLIAIRVLTGLAESSIYPSMHVLMSKWTTPQERSRIVTFIYAGAKIGIVITHPLAGFLCGTIGWESVFYITGGAGALWCLLSIVLIYDNPSEHPRISPEEYQYITISQGQQQAKGTLKVPWLKIATSPPVCALLVAHFVYNWGNFTLLTTLPQYMKFILDFDIKSNGLLSGLPYLLMWLFMVLTGVACDYLLSHNIMSVTNIRKFMMSFSFIGAAAFLLGVGFVQCDNILAVTLIVISIGLTGISWGGWSVNQLDLAPPYAGTLMGITNGFSAVGGIIGPFVVGALTKTSQTRASWRIFFYLTAGLYVLGSLVYSLFGSGKRQEWGYAPSADTTNRETAETQESK